MRVSQIFGLFVAAINLTGLASAANHAFSCDDKDLMEQCNQWCNCYDDHVNCGPGVTVGNKQWKLTTPGSRQARCYYECQCLDLKSYSETSSPPPGYCSERKGGVIEKCKNLIARLFGGGGKKKKNKHRRDLGAEELADLYGFLLRRNFEGFDLENRDLDWDNIFEEE